MIKRGIASIVFILILGAQGWTQVTDYRPYGKNADNSEITVLGYLNGLKITAGAGYVDTFDVSDGADPSVGIPVKTAGGRGVRAIRITDWASQQTKKDTFLITGCHHAREWNSVELCLRFAKFLVDNRNIENVFYDEVNVGPTPWSVPSLLRRAVIIIVPVLNPDGYVYSHDSAPGDKDEHLRFRILWRKNRRPLNDTVNPLAVGVDLNRAYPAFWEPIVGTATSPDPNSDQYRGPSRTVGGVVKQEGVEKEFEAIKTLHKAFNFTAVVNYHSHDNLVLYPWAHDVAPIPAADKNIKPDRTFKDRDYLIRVCNSYAVHQPSAPGLTRYRVGQSSGNLSYPTSGDADDWAYFDKKTVSITVEIGFVFQTPWAGNGMDNLYKENEPGLLAFLFANCDKEMRTAASLVDDRGRRPK